MASDASSFQALLFDLDDTLLDTSGLLVPAAHREAAAAMVAAGLPATVEEAYAVRLSLAARRAREDINQLVADHFGALGHELVEAGRRAFYERDVGPLNLDPEIAALLGPLQRRYRLFLVTAGSPRTQQAKVEALKLEPYFESIRYLDHQGPLTKQTVFEALSREHGLELARCVVIGDRPDAEIQAGNRLGCWTVRTLGGEHVESVPVEAAEIADYTIAHVTKLAEVLEELEKRGPKRSSVDPE